MAAKHGIPTATPAYEVEGDGLTLTVRLTADGRVQIKCGDDNFLALSPATTRLLAHHMNIVADSAPPPKRIRPTRAKPSSAVALHNSSVLLLWKFCMANARDWPYAVIQWPAFKAGFDRKLEDFGPLDLAECIRGSDPDALESKAAANKKAGDHADAFNRYALAQYIRANTPPKAPASSTEN